MSLNVLGDQIEGEGVNETRSSYWKTRNVHSVVIGKSRTKLLRQRFRRSLVDKLDVRGSVRHSTNHIEITNKMQPCTRIYYSSVLLIAEHVSSDTPLIIRSSKTVIGASGFTYVCLSAAGNNRLYKTRGCNYSF